MIFLLPTLLPRIVGLYCAAKVGAKEDTMKIGYARVSTSEQDLSGQLAALREAGYDRIYSEKRSGANDDRAALKRMLKEVQGGCSW